MGLKEKMENFMRKQYEDRDRFTLQEGVERLDRDSNCILHLTMNEDGSYSIVGHIVCNYCDFCEIQGDCRGRTEFDTVPATKSNIYEIVGED